MSSYYKTIDGVDYDRAMLETADKSIQGQGDGRISFDDAKTLVKNMEDGGKITEIEFQTLDYIYKNYKFTEPAVKFIEDSIAEYQKNHAKSCSQGCCQTCGN